MLAHRLVASGRATGIYFALPTMATANAMFERIKAIAPRLYAGGGSPSLALAHGRAGLHPHFRPVAPSLDRRTDAEAARDEDADSAAVAPEWLMAESRRTLLADLGIGTIDQALLAILPVRYQSVRLAGLAGKVLIVDEAHSYYAYVGAELDRLVVFHAAQGGSTIILSATLPCAVKSRLAAAWRHAVGEAATGTEADTYPGATLVAPGRPAVEVPLAARADLRRTLTLTRAPDMASALARIHEAVAADACIAFIRNTVDDASEAAAALRDLGIDAISSMPASPWATGSRLRSGCSPVSARHRRPKNGAAGSSSRRSVNRHGVFSPIGAGSRASVVDPLSFDGVQRGHTRVHPHFRCSSWLLTRSAAEAHAACSTR